MPPGPETGYLREIYELTKENNRMLHRMRRNSIIGGIFKIIWWALVLGLPVVLYYYYFQPYLDQLQSAYQGVQQGGQFPELPAEIRGFIDRLFSWISPSATIAE